MNRTAVSPPSATAATESPEQEVMETNSNTVPSLSKTEEENNSRMAGGSKRCKTNMPTTATTNIESLPDETIYDIIVRVPAQDICNATRLVCRKWHQMIGTRDFIPDHLQQSTCGLLIQEWGSKIDRPIFVATRKGKIDLSNFNCKFTRDVLSSCNGLVLEADSNYRDLHIKNHSTKQHFDLPPFSPKRTHRSAIAYAPATMAYKVVCMYYDNLKSLDECAILTIGADKDWTRRVNIQHLSLAPRMDILFLESPLTTDGFVHWAERGSVRVKGEPEYVLTLNIETEMITQFRVPLCDGERIMYYYLSTGNHLTLLIGRSGFFWEVWGMKSETGEWTKVTSIDLEAEKCRYEWVCLNCRLQPVGWLNFGQVLVFSVCKRTVFNISIPTKFTIAYDVDTHEIIDSFHTAGLSRFVVHRNSLVWLDLDGC